MQLIKTLITAGLSQPITFEGIPTEEPYGPSTNTITTDLATAIDFVLALERRENAAGCVNYDTTAIDKLLGNTDRLAQHLGYPSATVPGPSSSWLTEKNMEA